jgi:hypothetical protein
VLDALLESAAERADAVASVAGSLLDDVFGRASAPTGRESRTGLLTADTLERHFPHRRYAIANECYFSTFHFIDSGRRSRD